VVIKAVIFDMDGLILDTERVAMRAWMSAAAAHGLELSEQVYHGLIGLSSEEGRRYFKRQSWDDTAIELLETTAWTNYVALLEQEGVPHKPGLFELLDFLDGRQVRRAVATSTKTQSAKRRLDTVGVLGRFDAVVGGDQVERGKPAPDIYLRAAECLDRSPHECLVLEDSRNGVRAGAAAGMTVFLVPDICPIDRETEQLTACTAQSLLDVIAKLQPFV
jgi:HAD superfamily hydrolase (TIGR01509 family)